MPFCKQMDFLLVDVNDIGLYNDNAVFDILSVFVVHTSPHAKLALLMGHVFLLLFEL